MAAERTTNAVRPLGLAGAVFIALGVLSWTGSTLQSQALSSPPPIRLSFHSPVVALAPGDTQEAVLNLPQNATTPTKNVHVTVRARTSSLLTDDRVHGLQVFIEECQHGWSDTVRAGHVGYSCNEAPITVLGTRPVLMEGVPLADGSEHGTRYLRIRLRLPSEADNRFQGLHTAITYTFNGDP